MIDEIISEFNKNNIKIDEKTVKNLEKFNFLLIEANKLFNLTSIVEPKEVIEKHFLDSILPEKYFPKNAKCIDVGAGAGFPSVPLKIYREDLDFVMLDSLNKRVNFLNSVISNLNLKNAVAIHSRAEDLAKNPSYREQFDVATARAVAQLPTLCEYCLPFVKVGGYFIVYKSVNFNDEILSAENAIKILGGKIENVVQYQINNNNRVVIIIKKIKSTDKKYPRDKNKPRTNPL